MEKSVKQVITARRGTEGGGFPVRRPFPVPGFRMLDPFILLDEMGPVQWAAGEALGAPDHPHRGFETVTYLLQGHMQHRDSRGHSGELKPGDVQWMTAGSGVIHSELPAPEFQQQGGLMHGFQLWVNLPAKQKMIPPRYQEIPAKNIPQQTTEDGRVTVRVIAGEALGEHAVIDTVIPITYLHYSMKAGANHTQALSKAHNSFVYVFAGKAALGNEALTVHEGQLAILNHVDEIQLSAKDELELLLLSAMPINEPVVQHGPFVMNTEEEIHQAYRDYQQGILG